VQTLGLRQDACWTISHLRRFSRSIELTQVTSESATKRATRLFCRLIEGMEELELCTGSGRYSSDAFWVITSYFNFCHFASKRQNYFLFRSRLSELGVNCLTVECALAGDIFELPNDADIIRVRTSSVMWQKERLLNIALESLPSNCRFVAWVDSDLLFQNSRWHLESAAALETFGVVQLYEEVVRLPRVGSRFEVSGAMELSFMGGLNSSIKAGTSARLGSPGFAWAARKEVLNGCNGFYDACIVGGADRLMAHAWFGDYQAAVVRDIAIDRIWPHFELWAKQAHRVARGSVAMVGGAVHHLWHGELLNREYFRRHRQVAELGFDPVVDLTLNHYGCWEWNSHKPELHSWLKAYFQERLEDG